MVVVLYTVYGTVDIIIENFIFVNALQNGRYKNSVRTMECSEQNERALLPFLQFFFFHQLPARFENGFIIDIGLLLQDKKQHADDLCIGGQEKDGDVQAHTRISFRVK